MQWSTERIRCLVVEDDPYKLDSVRSLLRSVFKERLELVECRALSSASSMINSQVFDLAIIDMSIHSHELEAGAGSPFSLSSGGLDVLFEIAHSERPARCIILTQYPDIDVEGYPISTDKAKQEILVKFGIQVAGCVRYLEEGEGWKAEVTSILRALYEDRCS